MAMTRVTTIENLDTLTADEATDVKLVQQVVFKSLDDAQAYLANEFGFAGWFVHRGGHHVSLHRQDGGPRVLMVAERPYGTGLRNFGALKSAVQTARSEAQDECRAHGKALNADPALRRSYRRKLTFSFVRSRGTMIYTTGPTGRVRPIEDEPWPWGGTKQELLDIVELAQANPACDDVHLHGGFDLSETFDFDDYEPEVTTWQVTVWTRETGWQF